MRQRQRAERFKAIVREWNYGSVHTHEEVGALLGVEPRTHDYYAIISRARKPLMMDGKMIRVLRNHGYQVVSPDEYPTESVRTFERASRKIKESKEILQFAPRDLMSREAINHGNEVYGKVNTMSGFVQLMVQDLKKINNKNFKQIKQSLQLEGEIV